MEVEVVKKEEALVQELLSKAQAEVRASNLVNIPARTHTHARKRTHPRKHALAPTYARAKSHV